MIIRLFFLFVMAAFAAAETGCSRPAPAEEQAQVRQAFDGFKDQVTLGRAGPALDCLDGASRDYLQAAATRPPSSTEPATDLLIRRALEKFTRGPIGPDFTLVDPVQRLLALGILRPGDLDALTLGPVTVDADGQTAHAEVLLRGTSTTLQLAFKHEGDRWKINLLNLIPYAASAMTMDRAIKHETEDEQIARLVGALSNP